MVGGYLLSAGMAFVHGVRCGVHSRFVIAFALVIKGGLGAPIATALPV
jgi:hypothetical protein